MYICKRKEKKKFSFGNQCTYCIDRTNGLFYISVAFNAKGRDRTMAEQEKKDDRC